MKLSLRQRIIVYVGTPVLLVYAVLLAYFLGTVRERERRNARESLSLQSALYAQKMQTALLKVEQAATNLAEWAGDRGIGAGAPTTAEIDSQLFRNVRRDPLIYGSALAYEPNLYQRRRRYSPYVCRRGSKLVEIDIGTQSYDYTLPKWEWYAAPRKLGRALWTQPYFDEGAGNILMSTYSVPFFEQGRVAGIATIDIPLESLRNQIGLPRGKDIHFLVTTSDGQFVYNDERTRIMKDSLPEQAAREGRGDLTAVAQAMAAGGSGVEWVAPSAGQEAHWYAYAPIPATGWSLAAVVPESVVLREAHAEWWRAALGLTVSLLLILLAIFVVADRLARPIASLENAAARIAAGDLDATVYSEGTDEIAQLARTFQDMSARLRDREAALRDSRGDRLAHILAGLGGKYFYYSLRPNGILTYVSPSVETALGYSPEEYPRHMETLYTDNAINSARRAHTGEALRGGSPPLHEVEMRHRDGSVRRFEVCERPLRDDAGHVISVEGLVCDITERRQMEETLRGAKEAADSASRAKSEFLANMSHEIRTPMNAIIGMTHLALQDVTDRRQQGYLEKIDRASSSLLGIINDILDFSKIEAGKLRLERIDFDLENCLHSLCDVCALPAQDKNLELIFAVEPEVPTFLNGDPLRLNQVLINLVSNALKFTERGEVIVSIGVVEANGESAVLRFQVKDTGIGMSEEQRERIFGAFMQADASTTRRYGGTGLGLVICKRLVNLMDGEIGVESELGFGSTFHFTASFGVRTAQSRAALTTRSLRVLVVDDNATSREILGLQLSAFNFQVSLCASGPEGLERLCDAVEPYDLVFLDWKMPQMDGVETARIIRADGRVSRQPKVVMLTAYDREELEGEAREAGVAAFLVKPVSPSQLLEVSLTVTGNDADSPAALLAPAEDTAIPLRGARVLLVEDTEINRELAVEILRRAGVETDVAVNGQEGVDAVRRAADAGECYDAVIMDMQMPVMDGLEATRLLRQEERFAGLPIIAMTANAMAVDREQCLAAGMNAHIAKPVDVQVLHTTLARYMSLDRPADSIAHSADVPPLPQLPGVNVTAGLNRAMGNEELYQRLLVRFAESQQRDLDALRNAVRHGDRAALTMLTHTMKGVAANVGAMGVAQAAQDLENRGRNSSTTVADLQEELSILEGELIPLLQTLQEWTSARFPAEQPSHGTADDTLPDAELQAELAELEDLLRTGDTRALDAMAKLRHRVPAEMSLGAIERALQDFDFELALTELRHYREVPRHAQRTELT